MIEGETPYFIEHVFSELSPNPEISGIRASEFRMMPFTGWWETTMIEAETPVLLYRRCFFRAPTKPRNKWHPC